VCQSITPSAEQAAWLSEMANELGITEERFVAVIVASGITVVRGLFG
jgi:hypothetical protein